MFFFPAIMYSIFMLIISFYTVLVVVKMFFYNILVVLKRYFVRSVPSGKIKSWPFPVVSPDSPRGAVTSP